MFSFLLRSTVGACAIRYRVLVLHCRVILRLVLFLRSVEFYHLLPLQIEISRCAQMKIAGSLPTKIEPEVRIDAMRVQV